MPVVAQNLSSFSGAEVTALFRTSTRIMRTPFMDILARPATRQFGRILVVTPRRIGSAPARNKIRRQLKSLYYQCKLYERNLDLMVITKPQALETSFVLLQALLKSGVEKATERFEVKAL